MIDLNIKRVRTVPQPSPFADVQLVFFHCGCDALVTRTNTEVLSRIWCNTHHFMDRALPFAHGEQRREARKE